MYVLYHVLAFERRADVNVYTITCVSYIISSARCNEIGVVTAIVRLAQVCDVYHINMFMLNRNCMIRMHVYSICLNGTVKCPTLSESRIYEPAELGMPYLFMGSMMLQTWEMMV